jgi:hypothetical protein
MPSEEQQRDKSGVHSTVFRRAPSDTTPFEEPEYLAFGSPLSLRPSADDSTKTIPSWIEGQRIEARDCSGTWYVAKVVRVTPSGEQARLRVHFEGWSHEMDEVLLASSPSLRMYAGLQCFGPGGSDDHAAHMRLAPAVSNAQGDGNGTTADMHQATGPGQPMPPRGSSRVIQASEFGVDDAADAEAVQAATASASVEEELRARWAVVRGLWRRLWVRLMTRGAQVWVALRARLSVLALPLLRLACLILAMAEQLLRRMLSGGKEEGGGERGSPRHQPLKVD